MSATGTSIPTGNVDQLFRKHRIRVMLGITLGYGFIYICRLGLSIVKKPLIDEGIFTVEELGLIGAALLYGYGCGKFFNGFMSDHFRPRIFFSAAILISAVINMFMGFSEVVWLSVVLWALNGWFQGGAAPSAVILITNWFSIHERGRRYGLWNASHSIGEGMTFYVIAAAVAAYGWQYGFILPSIICLGVSAWTYAVLRDSPAATGLPTIHEWTGEETEEGKEESTWDKQKLVFGIRAIWIVAIASGLMYSTRYAINSWGILYLQETRGYSLPDAGIFLAINTAAGIFGSIAFGYFSDKVFDARRPPANLIFAIVEVLALFAIFYGPESEISLAIAFVVYGFTLSGLMASLGGLFAVDIAPRGATGAVMGFVGIFSYMAAATQDLISAALIGGGVTMTDDIRTYDFDQAIVFWIGSSVLSMLLAATLWNTKIRD